MSSADWISHFPGLRKLKPDVAKPLIEMSKVVRLPAGTLRAGALRTATAVLGGRAAERIATLVDLTVRRTAPRRNKAQMPTAPITLPLSDGIAAR